jgi:hypothetical protein
MIKSFLCVGLLLACNALSAARWKPYHADPLERDQALQFDAGGKPWQLLRRCRGPAFMSDVPRCKYAWQRGKQRITFDEVMAKVEGWFVAQPKYRPWKRTPAVENFNPEIINVRVQILQLQPMTFVVLPNKLDEHCESHTFKTQCFESRQVQGLEIRLQSQAIPRMADMIAVVIDKGMQEIKLDPEQAGIELSDGRLDAAGTHWEYRSDRSD